LYVVFGVRFDTLIFLEVLLEKKLAEKPEFLIAYVETGESCEFMAAQYTVPGFDTFTSTWSEVRPTADRDGAFTINGNCLLFVT